MNCQRLNLFKLFDAKDWAAVNGSDNKAALINIAYVSFKIPYQYDSFDTVKWRNVFHSYYLIGVAFYCSFDENGIEVVTKFPTLEIHSLSFRHNKIRKIEPRAFYNLTKLERLDLTDNKLTNQALQKEVFEGRYNPAEYEPMKSLKWLSLSNNDIHALNPDVFDHLDNLEELYLSNNPFKIIDPNSASAISQLNKLKVLDMSFMELRTIPEYMLHSPRLLSTLNLTGNLFTRLPEALHWSVNLVHLNLNDNPFEQIGGEYVFKWFRSFTIEIKTNILIPSESQA